MLAIILFILIIKHISVGLFSHQHGVLSDKGQKHFLKAGVFCNISCTSVTLCYKGAGLAAETIKPLPGSLCLISQC